MTTITYEATECSRCGGTGHYSYNQMDGTRCFKCGGSKKQLTKRGKAAKAFADELLDIKIQDVPEGSQFMYFDLGCIYKFCTAVENPGRGVTVNGERVPTYDIVRRNGQVVCSAGAGIRVRLHPTAEQVQEINDYQDSLTKAGKPRKK